MRPLFFGGLALLLAACSSSVPDAATSSSNLDETQGVSVVRRDTGFYAARELADASVIAAHTYSLGAAPSGLMKLRPDPQGGASVVAWDVGLGSGATQMWLPDADHVVVGLAGNDPPASNPIGSIVRLERRLVSDGSLDPAFGSGGSLDVPSGLATELAPDGSLLVLVARAWEKPAPAGFAHRRDPSQLGVVRVDVATGATTTTDFPPLPAWGSDDGQILSVHALADGSYLTTFATTKTTAEVVNGTTFENSSREIGAYVLRDGQPPARTSLGFCSATGTSFVTSHANADGSFDLVYNGNVGDLAPSLHVAMMRIHVNADGTKGAITTLGEVLGAGFPFSAFAPVAFQNDDLVMVGAGTGPDGTFSTSVTRLAPNGTSTVTWSRANTWSLLFPQPSGALYGVTTRNVGFGDVDVTLQRLP